MSFLPILWMLLLAILAAGVYVGLCAAEGAIPVVGKTKEEIQASIAAAIESLKKGASEAGAKASATASNASEKAKAAADRAHQRHLRGIQSGKQSVLIKRKEKQNRLPARPAGGFLCING